MENHLKHHEKYVQIQKFFPHFFAFYIISKPIFHFSESAPWAKGANWTLRQDIRYCQYGATKMTELSRMACWSFCRYSLFCGVYCAHSTSDQRLPLISMPVHTYAQPRPTSIIFQTPSCLDPFLSLWHVNTDWLYIMTYWQINPFITLSM